MNDMTRLLTGVVSEPVPAMSPTEMALHELRQETHDLLNQNDRLARQVQRLELQLQVALARVAELLAAAKRKPEPILPAVPRVQIVGRLRLDLDRRRLSIGGRETPVSRRVGELLGYLMARQGQAVTTIQIARALNYTDADAVRSAVHRTRTLLATGGAREYLRNYMVNGTEGRYWIEEPS